MKIVLLPGDGVGPEVTQEAVKVLKEIGPMFDIEPVFEEHAIGGDAIAGFGSPLPKETADACLAADAVLLGAVGSPEYDAFPPEARPEVGLLQLRRTLQGFANLRPAKAFPSLESSSPLRPEILKGTDLLVVRELIGGLYFGEPRGTSADGTEAYNTMRYTEAEVERVARIAFTSAASRKGKVTSVDKANVLETSQLWRRTVEKIGREFPSVTLEHMYVDACSMHLVTEPARFDVILTENLFGDILSDEAGVLTGSLGMLSSATIGGPVGLYEPVHGSAPRLASKNIANPIGAILSAALMLRYSAKNETAAVAIEEAVRTVLDSGCKTRDIHGEGDRLVATDEMGTLVRDAAVEAANCRYAYHAV